jgi:hypothetical protein
LHFISDYPSAAVQIEKTEFLAGRAAVKRGIRARALLLEITAA